jgi:hypothetical protein
VRWDTEENLGEGIGRDVLRRQRAHGGTHACSVDLCGWQGKRDDN